MYGRYVTAVALCVVALAVTAANASLMAPTPPMRVCAVNKTVDGSASGSQEVDCHIPCDALYNVTVRLHSTQPYGASLGSYPVWFSVCGNNTNGFRVTGDCHLQYYGFVSGSNYNIRVDVSTTSDPAQIVTVSETVTQISNCTFSHHRALRGRA